MARYLTDYDPQVRASLFSRFGATAFHRNGALLRGKLGRIVFDDAQARLDLEAILHPGIKSCVEENVVAARAVGEHLVAVVPLLFELGMEGGFDETWLVVCEPTQQLERLKQRSGMEEADARKWIAAQWPQERKAPLATRVLVNNAKIDDFKHSVLDLWEGFIRDGS